MQLIINCTLHRDLPVENAIKKMGSDAKEEGVFGQKHDGHNEEMHHPMYTEHFGGNNHSEGMHHPMENEPLDEEIGPEGLMNDSNEDLEEDEKSDYSNVLEAVNDQVK
ncbi:hypothetical protein GVAV_001738 [Gurleya vavrai]